MDVLALSTNFSRSGFPSLLLDAANPAVYGKRTFSNSAAMSHLERVRDGMPSTSAVIRIEHRWSSADAWQYPATEAGSASNSGRWGSVMVSNYVLANGTTEHSTVCQKERAPLGSPDGYPNGSCDGIPGGGFENSYDNLRIAESNLTSALWALVKTGSNTTSVVEDPYAMTNWDTCVVGSYINLEDPCALQTFLASAVLPSVWPSWTNATSRGWACRGGQNVYRVVDADRSAFNATASKIKYRIAYFGPQNERGTIKWVERFVPAGSGNALTTEFSRDVQFTGQEQYVDITGGEDGKIVEMPEANGMIEVFLSEQNTWGCGSGACPVAGAGQLSASAPLMRLDLGKNSAGEPAGFLYWPDFEGRGPRVFAGHEVDVVWKSGSTDEPRQVRTASCLADLLIGPNGAGTVSFYAAVSGRNADGLYVSSGSAFAVWTLGPTGGSQVTVAKSQDPGAGGVFARAGGMPEGWSLSRTGAATAETCLWVPDTTVFKTNVRWVSNSSGNANRYELRAFKDLGRPDLGGGLQLVERRVGSDAAPEVTTYSYYEDPTEPGNFGLVREAVYPAGNWERTDYLNRLPVKVVSPWLNSARSNADENAHRVTLYSYTPLAGSGDTGTRFPTLPRTTIETVQGLEVSRSYRIVSDTEITEIQRVAPGAGWTQSDLVTRRSTYSVAGLDGVQERVTRPDGSVEISHKTPQRPGAFVTNTVWTGALSADGKRVASGTQVVTMIRPDGRVASEETIDITSGATVDLASYQYLDDFPHSSVTTIQRQDGTSTSSTYDCCGLQSATDEDGVVTSYTYDALRRLVTETRAGVVSSNVFDAAGNILETWQHGSSGPAIRTRAATYDLAGRQTAVMNALGFTNLFLQSTNGAVKTNIYPNGGMVVESYALDGTLLSSTGSVARPVRYTNFVELDSGINSLVVQEIKLNADGTDSGEWTKTYSDMLGRPCKTVHADGATARSVWNAAGQLWKEIDEDGVAVVHEYDAEGRRSITKVGGARASKTMTEVDWNAEGVRVRRSTAMSQNDQGAWVAESIQERALDEAVSWQGRPGCMTRTTVERLGGGERRVAERSPDGSSTVALYSEGRLQSVTRSDASGAVLGQTEFTYDPYGRQVGAADGRTGLTTNFFDPAGQLLSVTAPAPNPGDPAHTVSVLRDRMGVVTNTLYPDGTGTASAYSLAGDLTAVFGSRTYASGYRYDVQGRLLSMTNWTNFSSRTGQRVTGWTNDPVRGRVSMKRDALANGADYAYTPAGRLRERLWARGNPRIKTTYTTNIQGGLASVVYSSDPASTPAVSLAYDAQGRPKTVTQGAATTTLTWNDAGQLLGESWIGGPLSGLAVTNIYDSMGRRTSVQLLTPGGILNRFYYDGASRLRMVSNEVVSATYSYLALSALAEQIDFRRAGLDRMITRRTYDNLNRLAEVFSLSTRGGVFSFAYAYNLAGQRTRVSTETGAWWDYHYDALGQLTFGKRRWSDNSLVPGQQFEYFFDDIGNRLLTKAGGDATGASLRSAAYEADSANQYVQRGVPGAFDVGGASPAAATVSITGGAPQRHGEFFSSPLAAANTTPVWAPMTVNATQGSTNQTVAGRVFIPANPESFLHDLDGNLTRDGRWDYTWDAENRLVSMETIPAAYNAGAPRQRLVFAYDWQGRRIRKTVSNWVLGQWSVVTDHSFVYDGWNLLAVLGPGNTPLQSFVWGTDASGSMQGAGGVGGLLAARVHTGTNAGTYFFCYDGNWNVVGLVNAAGGSVAARYEYGPFHELIRASGPIASENPFQAATKYRDSETGLYYYGYRYYNPGTGRWLSRDPIGEEGGVNRYGFCANSTLDYTDRDGMDFGVWTGAGASYRNWTPPSGKPLDPAAGNLFFDYLMGTPNSTRHFGDGDLMTESIKRSRIMEMRREDMRQALKAYCLSSGNPHPHTSATGATVPLGGELKLIPKWEYAAKQFWKDLALNPAAAFTGSFSGGSITTITVDCCKGEAKIHVHAINRSGLQSNTRFSPPGGGYSDGPSVADLVTHPFDALRQAAFTGIFPSPTSWFSNEPFGANAQFNTITQIYDWNEPLKFESW